MSRYPPLPPAAGSIYPIFGKGPTRGERAGTRHKVKDQDKVSHTTPSVHSQAKSARVVSKKEKTDERRIPVITKAAIRALQLPPVPVHIRELFNATLERSRHAGHPIEIRPAADLGWAILAISRNSEQNRPISIAQIKKMAAVFLNKEDPHYQDKFFTESNPVCYDTNGILEVGQHRATTELLLQTASRHVIKIGVEPGSERNRDLSKYCDAKDHMAAEGKKNAGVRASVIRMLLRAEGIDDPTDTDVKIAGGKLGVTEEFESAIKYGMKYRGSATVTALGVAYYLIASRTADKEKALCYLEEIQNGIQHIKGVKVGTRKSAIKAIMDQLAFYKAQRLGAHSRLFSGDRGNRMIASAIIIQYNAYPDKAERLDWSGPTYLPEVK